MCLTFFGIYWGFSSILDNKILKKTTQLALLHDKNIQVKVAEKKLLKKYSLPKKKLLN